MFSSFSLISALLRGTWLIEPGFAKANLPAIEAFLSRESNRAMDQEQENEKAKSQPVFLAAAQGTFQVYRYSSFDDAPAGSIAIIDVDGPIMKHDSCGTMGMLSLADKIDQANRHPNISAIILRADTPGGAVFGTATGADAVKNSEKPVLTWVSDGMLASAGVWLTSGSTEIYAGQPTDTIGSIGVYQTLVNRTGQYKQMGIEVIEIYADGSEDKNAPYRQALEGDTSGIKAEVNFIRERFIATIKENRPQVSEKAFTGKMFNASEAQELGLIDGILSFEQVVARAQELAQTSSNSTAPNKTMFSKFKKVAALKGEDTITEASLEAANLELQAEGITGAELVAAGTTEAHQVELAHAEAELTTANEKITEQSTRIAELEGQLATANSTIATLSGKPGTEGTNLKQEGDDDHDTQAPKVLSSWEQKAQQRAKRK
ncbi:MAG: S49 family peptidase [Adhaeribacter sp.]